MSDKRFTIFDLLDLELKEHNALDLVCIAGRKGLGREIKMPDLNRPGLALSGFFDNFAWQRIQIFGRGENAYLRKLGQEGRSDTVQKMMSFEIPCCIFTHSLMPDKGFIELAEAAKCPVLKTDLTLVPPASCRPSLPFRPSSRPCMATRRVFSSSILIIGESGVGKSEAALELIERAIASCHDVVELAVSTVTSLWARGPAR